MTANHSITGRLISLKGYQELKSLRDNLITTVSWDHHKLNEFHDEIMIKVIQLALEKVESEWGKPPAHFAFFIMGSAGRGEQSVWSDQDHGIIFDGSDHYQNYFIKVGEEIASGLTTVGYEQCDGNVMASNPRWCKSVQAWEKQLLEWLSEADWESLRYFSTFFDSRVLIGNKELLLNLKKLAFATLDTQPFLYKRLYENVGFIKRGIGVFGQLLFNEKGEEAGTLNLKQTIFFPYVNSLRLLAFIEKITEAATIDRFRLLPSNYSVIKSYQADFIKLLNYRLFFQKDATSYKNVHLLQVKAMSAKEREAIKQIMRNGHKLFKETKEIIEKRCSQ